MSSVPESRPQVATWSLPTVVDDCLVTEAGSELRRLARSGLPELRIDARHVTDVSVRGLALLVAVHRLGTSCGTRVVVLPSDRLTELVHRMGLSNWLPLTKPNTTVVS